MPTKIPAAQYLRMSTEHQQYSTLNQSAAIQEYAESHGFEIVRTYEDTAKSGLDLKRRSGLKSLLKDVVSGTARYQAILVYDVSRWGRFQDADESAHYEFLCKMEGIRVHYCAESFPNDDSLMAVIFKAVKRTMAGEYSRELSAKVYEGHKRLAQLGFKQGGMPGYGLRRMLVDANGTEKGILCFGERKSIATDRVILVPGPASEVALVQRVFDLFINDRLSLKAIARRLNGEGIPWEKDRPWSHQTIRRMLASPKYMGAHVYGRTTAKLNTAPKFKSVTEWVYRPSAWESVVSEKKFASAQFALASLKCNQSNEQILAALKTLLGQTGVLNTRMIDASAIASASSVRRRFGSIRAAYRLIGYVPGRRRDRAT